MKNLLLPFSLLFCFNITAQDLRVVTAEGGEGKNIDWTVIKQRNESEDGPGIFSICSQGLENPAVSSALAPQGNFKYNANNLTDYDPMTAWVEGKKGYGIGEWFEVQGQSVNTIYNGFQYSPSVWAANSRVKRFKVYFDGKAICYLDLTDEMGAQRFDLGLEGEYNYDNNHIFRFEIVDVYKGSKYDDVCISHVDLVLCCVNSGTVITGSTGNTLVDNVSQGTQIKTMDLAGMNLFDAEVSAVTNQIHVTLLKIKTQNHSIEITPDHPLYVEGKGFISLEMLLKKMDLTSYNQLVYQVQVMVWNELTDAPEYETITSIEVMKGSFNTYTITGLSLGDTYIANGFVTQAY